MLTAAICIITARLETSQFGGQKQKEQPRVLGVRFEFGKKKIQWWSDKYGAEKVLQQVLEMITS